MRSLLRWIEQDGNLRKMHAFPTPAPLRVLGLEELVAYVDSSWNIQSVSAWIVTYQGIALKTLSQKHAWLRQRPSCRTPLLNRMVLSVAWLLRLEDHLSSPVVPLGLAGLVPAFALRFLVDHFAYGVSGTSRHVRTRAQNRSPHAS